MSVAGCPTGFPVSVPPALDMAGPVMVALMAALLVIAPGGCLVDSGPRVAALPTLIVAPICRMTPCLKRHDVATMARRWRALQDNGATMARTAGFEHARWLLKKVKVKALYYYTNDLLPLPATTTTTATTTNGISNGQ